MKLLSKLLPIATVAAASTIVVPFMSSCGASQSNMIETDIFSLRKNNYLRTTAVKEPTKFSTVEEGFESYLNDVSHNKNILTDDIFDFVSQNKSYKFYGLYEAFEPMLLNYLESATSIVNAEQTPLASSISSATIGLETTDVNVEKHLVSLQAKLDLHIDYSITVYTEEIGQTITLFTIPLDISTSIQFNNIKVDMSSTSGSSKLFNRWLLYLPYINSRYGLDLWSLSRDTDWSIKLDASLNCPFSDNTNLSANINNTYNHDSLNDKDVLKVLASLFGGRLMAKNYKSVFGFVSNYYANVTCLERSHDNV